MAAGDVLGRNLERTISGICLLLNLIEAHKLPVSLTQRGGTIGGLPMHALARPYSFWAINDRNAKLGADVTA